MQVRKVIVGSVMMGALSAAGMGLAGTASATTPSYHPPKVTYSYQSTTVKKTVVVKDNQQVGNGNTQQTASGNAGAINNPQVGFGTNVGLQVPLNVPVLSGNAGGSNTKGGESEAGAGQSSKLSQDATGNYSNNSTSVNTAAQNGNFSKVEIGN
jgi:hypothetical protein